MNTPKKPVENSVGNPVETSPVSEPAMVPPPAEEERLDDILTDAEIAAIRAEATKKVEAERKAARKKAYMDLALQEARRAAGTEPTQDAHDADMAQLMRIFIDLPRLRKATGGELEPDPIILDQRIFSAGRWYDVTKAQAIYLNSLMDMARRHVAAVDGRSRTYYDGNRGSMVYQGGTAAGGPSGPSFDSIHRRPA